MFQHCEKQIWVWPPLSNTKSFSNVQELDTCMFQNYKINLGLTNLISVKILKMCACFGTIFLHVSAVKNLFGLSHPNFIFCFLINYFSNHRTKRVFINLLVGGKDIFEPKKHNYFFSIFPLKLL